MAREAGRRRTPSKVMKTLATKRGLTRRLRRRSSRCSYGFNSSPSRFESVGSSGRCGDTGPVGRPGAPHCLGRISLLGIFQVYMRSGGVRRSAYASVPRMSCAGAALRPIACALGADHSCATGILGIIGATIVVGCAMAAARTICDMEATTHQGCRAFYHEQCKMVSVATLVLRRRFLFVGRSLRAFGSDIYSQTKRSASATNRVRQGHRWPASNSSLQFADFRHALLVAVAGGCPPP